MMMKFEKTYVIFIKKNCNRPEKFHAQCDGYSPTLTIIQTTNNHVFGGFTTAVWATPEKDYHIYEFKKSTHLCSSCVNKFQQMKRSKQCMSFFCVSVRQTFFHFC